MSAGAATPIAEMPTSALLLALGMMTSDAVAPIEGAITTMPGRPTPEDAQVERTMLAQTDLAVHYLLRYADAPEIAVIFLDDRADRVGVGEPASGQPLGDLPQRPAGEGGA